MYIPESFKVSSREKIDSFMDRFSFGTVITPDTPIQVTHCPILFRREGESLRLAIHFARSNPHSKPVSEGRETLVIFPGPHGYISPRWYQKVPAVPTWNYGVVHAQGKPTLVENPERIQAYFAELVRKYEGPEGLPEGIMPLSLVGQLSSAILLFEIEVADVEAKFKLGQNRSREDQESIHRNLIGKGDPDASALAAFMVDFGGFAPRD